MCDGDLVIPTYFNSPRISESEHNVATPQRQQVPKQTKEQLEKQPAVEPGYEDPAPQVQGRWNRDMVLIVGGLLAIFIIVIIFLIVR